MNRPTVLILLSLLMGIGVSSPARAQEEVQPATTNGPLNFLPVSSPGFGDRQNSWAWSIQWWNDHIYVGTNRAFGCVKQWELNISVSPVLFPYPPNNPEIVCTQDPADLPLQAEIWKFHLPTKTWDRVYQSPADLVNPDEPSKSLAEDIGYRTMTIFTETDGTEALYVGGVSSQPMWTGNVPPPRILRSTDGVNFAPIPQDPGTFMADLPYSDFRNFATYNGSLFVVNGKAEGEGILIESPTPEAGDDAWQQVSPSDLSVFSLAVFNGYLYVGTLDSKNGYSVLKTNAQGPPPYTFTTIVPSGAYAPGNPGAYAWSMHVFGGQLYVGAGMLLLPNPNNCDLIRINTDDTWELVAGTPRDTPQGSLYPISGLPNGFGNEFNDGLWSIDDSQGTMFLGSDDESNGWSFLPGIAPSLGSVFGFDLFATADGTYFTQITHNGFNNGLNYGVSRMASTPYGLFLGAANVEYGLSVWSNSTQPSSFPAPTALQLELSQGSPVLSWEPAPGATKYRILRAPIVPYTLYPPLFGDQNVTGPYVDIGSSTGTTFKDTPLAQGDQYLYFVQAKDASGNLSDPSNLAYAPPLMPEADLAGLLAQVDSLAKRNHFTSHAGQDRFRQTVQQANALAAMGNSQDVLDLLNSASIDLKQGLVEKPYDSSLEIYLARLIRRLALVQSGKLITPVAVTR